MIWERAAPSDGFVAIEAKIFGRFRV